MPYNTSTDNYQTSKFIVDNVGFSPFTTIQAAINEAQAEGNPAAIIIRPGTYVENLTLYDGIQLEGVPLGEITITGIHTPPNAGTVTFTGIQFTSATHILNSAAAGTTGIAFTNCSFNLTNGYIFNLPNWTGGLIMNDCLDSSTRNGVINNAGTSEVVISNSFVGVANTMTTNGLTRINNCILGCPTNFQGVGAAFIYGGSSVTAPITFSAGSTGFIINSYLETGALTTITHNSGSTVTLADVTISSTNPTVIAGTGIVEFGSVTYLSNDTVAGTIIKDFTTRLETGELKIDDADTGSLIATAGVVSPLTMNNGQLVIGRTGLAPAAGNLTSIGGTINITNGVGTINLESGGPVASTFTTDAGNAIPALGVLNVFGGNNIGTTGAGNTITINLDGTTDHAIQVGNAGGSLTSLAVGATGTVLIGNTGANPSFTAAMTNGQLLIGNTGNVPTLAGLTPGAGIAITSGAGSITVSAWGGGVSWTNINANQALVPNNGVNCTGGAALSLSLPATSSVGDVIEVVLDGSTSWTITQGANQQIRLGSSTTTLGAGGSLASTAQGDHVKLVCKTANLVWTCIGVIGNITIV